MVTYAKINKRDFLAHFIPTWGCKPEPPKFPSGARFSYSGLYAQTLGISRF
jgi:hypothetical protein